MTETTHPPSSQAAPPSGRRRWRWPLTILAALLALPLLLACALWVWAGREGSLQTVLDQAPRWLPSGYTLQTQEVSGSLRRGGRIGRLQWTQPGTQLTLSGLDLHWQAEALLRHRHLHIDRIEAEQLEVRHHGQADPSAPPDSLALPVTVEARLALKQLRLPDQGGLQAEDLQADYRFDGRQHQLTLHHLALAAGHYQGQIQLQAAAPMALQARLGGQLQTGLKAPAPAALEAQARLEGPLSGRSAELHLDLTLQPPPGSPAASMQAHAEARLQPWADQPLPEALVRLSRIDLRLLWPGAPQTALSGRLDIRPATGGQAGWTAQADFDNPLAGPWDQQRLPLSQLSARMHQQGAAWIADAVQARVGQGRLDLSGRWQGDLSPAWQAHARLQDVNPADLFSRLPPAALRGELQARPGREAGLDFDADLDSRPLAAAEPARPRAPTTLASGRARLNGHWQADQLRLDRLELTLWDARIEGQLRLAPSQGSGQGTLRLSAPGLQAELEGDLAADRGQGRWQARWDDAGRLGRWLKQLPGLPPPPIGWPERGSGRFEGHWQGGWGRMMAAWNGHPAGTRLPPPLQLDARLDIPALNWPALAVKDLEARLQATLPGPVPAQPSGPAAAAPLQLSLRGQVQQGAQTLSARLRASGGAGLLDASGSRWQARLDELSLQASQTLPGGDWRLDLSQAVGLQLHREARTDLTELRLEAGEAQLGSPGGPARLQWQASQWSTQKGHARWQTSGDLRDLSLAWFQALAAQRPDTARLGVAGDMRFDAHWSAQADSTLQAQASLKRQGGDLRLQPDDLPSGVQASEAQRSAGARQAELNLKLDDRRLSAELLWDSERAGRLQASLGTQLEHRDGGWDWPQEAPLDGQIEARLPRLGVWSVLAPPGWRMRGTLQASARLSGTRGAPQWQGSVQASDLALRSVVEGIELREGRLAARLNGPQMTVDEFSLRGAPGAGGDGGSLRATGQAHWNGEDLQIDLHAHADHLRVSARADRRLAVSGDIDTRLDAGRVQVRGQLRADQALFILPDETAPSLGADVQVIRPQAAPTAAAANTPDARKTPGPDVQVSLDLGKDFQVRGRGLETRLAGSLQLRITPADGLPVVHGELHTDHGHYAAYGQQLTIEQGVLRFDGAYDNPSLDILAIRPNLSTRVGVQISGTVLSPRIRLYSEPEMADADKLAWLVLGRAAANGAAESALLQQAALALLGKGGRGLSDGLAHALGLDEISFSGVSSTDTGVSSAALKLGKRLSKDFYVSYERSLTGTLGTFYVFYDLTRRFTLRAQTGEKSAIDLIFTVRYD
ncbi:MAG: translocation/assembly module TamB domain-containing protein [Curvibacter sp.]|nr:translocation/assembly module TamB domain-containing protein [Curvibacter sp.]